MARASLAERLHGVIRTHHEILSGRYPNAGGLAKLLKVSDKTARNYLRILCESFGLNPCYDPHRHGYYYPNGAELNPVPRLTENEVITVFLMESAARGVRDMPAGKVLESALEKLRLLLPRGEGLSLDDTAAAMSWRAERAPAGPAPDPHLLDALYRSILTRNRIRIEYNGRNRGSRTHRKIEPLHLARCEGQWYLVAFCRLRKQIRTFVPARMEDAKVLQEVFQPPADFDPRAHFRTAFGIVADHKVDRVVLEFTAQVAPIIRERQWHPTQWIEELSEGGVRLTLTCSQSEELESWILGWSDQVTIKSPKTLKRQVARKHKRAWEKSAKANRP